MYTFLEAKLQNQHVFSNMLKIDICLKNNLKNYFVMSLLKVAFMAKILQKTFCYKTLNFTTDDHKKIHKRHKCLRNSYKLNQIVQNNVFVKTNLNK